MQKGSQIKADDRLGLISLSRDLEECDITLKHLNFHPDLDNFENLTKIIKRLPFASQTCWLKIAADIEKRGLDPKFNDVVNFGKEKAKVARLLLSGVVHQRSKRTERISSHFTNIAVSHHETPQKVIKVVREKSLFVGMFWLYKQAI